jgi:RNA polymerase sigma factor (sigma-70 family)
MPLSEKEILRFLMQSRERILAAAWLVVKDAHVAEDILTLIHHDWQNDLLNPKENRFEVLRDCMEELPQKSEKILHLCYFEGLSCGEIADYISITLGAVYKRLSRIQNSLRKYFEIKMEPGGNQ